MFDFILPFIGLILVVVFIHEYGHYYYAKKYGVGVTDFSIGFGKEIFGWNDKSGTRWKICWIPLGGYVKFFGDRNVFSQSDQIEVLKFKGDYLKLSKNIIILLSAIALIVASKGLSILYLFLLADLLCCAAVLTVFYSFYDKKLSEKNAYVSIIIGLFVGLLLFPSPDFSKSILIGILFPVSNFPIFMSQSLLFMSFLLATFVPIVTWKIK